MRDGECGKVIVPCSRLAIESVGFWLAESEVYVFEGSEAECRAVEIPGRGHKGTSCCGYHCESFEWHLRMAVGVTVACGCGSLPYAHR
jgi:hypothetical protein